MKKRETGYCYEPPSLRVATLGDIIATVLAIVLLAACGVGLYFFLICVSIGLMP
jgi:hypothetical protein